MLLWKLGAESRGKNRAGCGQVFLLKFERHMVCVCLCVCAYSGVCMKRKTREKNTGSVCVYEMGDEKKG